MDSDKLDYFIDRTERDLDEIKFKLEKLWDFRLFLIGSSVAISSLCSILTSVLYVYLKMN